MDQAYTEFYNTINAKTKRYLHTSANAKIIGDKVLELASGNESALLQAGAWLTAWAVCQSEGSIEEPPIDEEAVKQHLFDKKESERRLNVEREARDRRDGNVGTPRGHMSETEKERAELEATQNLVANLSNLKERLKNDVENPQRHQELGVNDAFFALTRGDRSIPLTQAHVAEWLQKWPADQCRTVRRSHEDLRTRMDTVLKTGVDPMTGVGE
jgi:hypothetical protein